MNLGFDDNRVFFFLDGGELGYFGGRRKKQMKWQEKGAVWSKTSERAPFEWNAVSSKNFEIKPSPPHTHPHLSGFEPGGMLSVTFEKWQRRGRTVHLSETPVFSLFGETYPAEPITLSAWKQRVLSVDPRYRARKTDNAAKWCPSVTDLMLNFGMLPVNNYTAYKKRSVRLLQ